MAETFTLNLQLKTKEDVVGSGLGLQRGERRFTWRCQQMCDGPCGLKGTQSGFFF